MRTSKNKYFLINAILFLIIMVGGFTHSSIYRVTYQSLPFYLAFHILTMTLWYVGYFYQTLQVYKGHIINHQKMGKKLIILVVLMVIANLNLQYNIASEAAKGLPSFEGELRSMEGLYNTGALVLGNLYITLTSLILLIIGYVNRKSPEIHKRAMLGATAILLQPAWDRFIHPFNLQEISIFLKFMSINIFPIALIIYDIRKRRKPYWVTMVFFLLLILTAPLLMPLINMGVGEMVVNLLGN
jgi:hypothetical protein